MPITYKTVVIIIDDFTTNAITRNNTTLYDAGYVNTIREYDTYLNGFGYFDGYGDVDYSEYIYEDTSLQYHQVDTAKGYKKTLTQENSFVDIYGYNTYYKDYIEWVAHETSNDTLQHGDWVLDAYIKQLEQPNLSEIILIDTDSSAGYINETQGDNLFSLVESAYTGKIITTLEAIIEDWLANNNTQDVKYIPTALSYSIAGPETNYYEALALEMLAKNYVAVVQATQNVGTQGSLWGQTHPEVINVGAYNVDINSNSLHSGFNEIEVIDILADGYIENQDWGIGWNFGTSFATPRVTAEITNLLSAQFQILNQKLESGEITQSDLDSQDRLSYQQYIQQIVETIASPVYVETQYGWLNYPLPVLADDIQSTTDPYKINNINIGREDFNIVSTTDDAPKWVLTDGYKIQGSKDNDWLTTTNQADVIYAEQGNDYLELTADDIWGAGYIAKNINGTNQIVNLEGYNRYSDVIDGGENTDTIKLASGDNAFFIDDIYSPIHSSVSLDTALQGVDSSARIFNIEKIDAGNGNDIIDLSSINYSISDVVINTGEGADIIWASNGNDKIISGAGNDILFGGSGDDILTGGTEDDTFQFTQTAGSDTITDFSVKDDKIELYYNTGDNHANTDLSLTSGVLTWNANSNDVVSIDMSATINSSSLTDIDQLVTFVEIV